MDKETLKKVLGEFVATVNSNTSQTEDEILSKFPELKGYDKKVLAEFVATVNSNTSQTEDEILSKFPEFTANMAKPINEPQKKRLVPSLWNRPWAVVYWHPQVLSNLLPSSL